MGKLNRAQLEAYKEFIGQRIDARRLIEGFLMTQLGINAEKGMELFTRERIFWLIEDKMKK